MVRRVVRRVLWRVRTSLEDRIELRDDVVKRRLKDEGAIGQLERDLSQQDVDLMITFKSCIQSIFES